MLANAILNFDMFETNSIPEMKDDAKFYFRLIDVKQCIQIIIAK